MAVVSVTDPSARARRPYAQPSGTRLDVAVEVIEGRLPLSHRGDDS
ncbi:hypothetical protein [Nocardioides sp. LHG3406-4]